MLSERSIAGAVKLFLLDLLFPIECLGCREPQTYLCRRCLATIPLEDSFCCPVCARPSFEGRVCARCRRATPLDGLISASFYDDPLLRRALFCCKYQFVKDLALPLALLLLKRLKQHPFSVLRLGDPVLVGVPLLLRRERWRGFNQALEIARVLAAHLLLPLAGGALVRVRSAPPQARVEEREERFLNVRGVFAIQRSEAISGRAILLVDDVATTLATLSECARVLREAGARQVWGLVVAREHLKK